MTERVGYGSDEDEDYVTSGAYSSYFDGQRYGEYEYDSEDDGSYDDDDDDDEDAEGLLTDIL